MLQNIFSEKKFPLLFRLAGSTVTTSELKKEAQNMFSERKVIILFRLAKSTNALKNVLREENYHYICLRLARSAVTSGLKKDAAEYGLTERRY